ncbi:MAG: hypothetical protein IJS48_02815, partial [Prevotella sp.]|nr:hypothetical protein [Prevotella sp.]
RFSVHRNAKADASAPDTFHVCPETLQTVGNGIIMQYLKIVGVGINHSEPLCDCGEPLCDCGEPL